MEDEKTPLVKTEEPPKENVYSLGMYCGMGGVILTGGALLVGIIYGIFGATLPDLALLVDVNLEGISTIFVWMGLGVILGCSVSSTLFSRYHSFLVLGSALSLNGIALIVLPWCPGFISLTVMGGVGQFFTGIISVGTCFQCFYYWGKSGQSMIQAYQFINTIGKALSPIMASPFVVQAPPGGNIAVKLVNFTAPSKQECPALNWLAKDNNKSSEMLTLQPLVTMGNNSLFDPIHSIQNEKTNVQYIYLLVGLLCLIVSCFYFLIFVLTRKHFTPTNKKKSQMDKEKSTGYSKKDVLLLIFAFWFSFLYSGLEVQFTGLLLSWVSESLGWTKSTGILLTLYFQVVKVVVNGLVVIISKFVSSWMIFLYDVIIIVVSTITMTALYGHPSCALGIWVTTGFVAFSLSTIHAAGMGTVSTQMEFSGFVSSIFIGAYGLGTMAIPPITTYFFTQHGAIAFPYIAVTQSILIASTFVGIACVVYGEKKEYKTLSSHEISVQK